MAGIQLSGLSSGFDWKTVVDQLIAVSRSQTQGRLQTEKSTVTQKQSAISEIKTSLASFQSAVATLKDATLYDARKTAFSDSTTTWTSSADSGAVPGSYSFHVNQLATQASWRGAKAGTTLADAVASPGSGDLLSALNLPTAVTSGFFTVNGTQITVASTDTIGTVLASIQSALQTTSPSATASLTSDKIQIDTGDTNSFTIGSAADTSNFLQVFRLFQGNVVSGATNTLQSAGTVSGLRQTTAVASLSLSTPYVAPGTGDPSFTINGISITYAGTDSLKSLLSKINDSAAGVSATYDAGTDKLILKNKTTGNVGISAVDVNGNILAALGVTPLTTLVAGRDAQFTVDGGGVLTSRSNKFDSSSHGIEGLSVTADSEGSSATQTVTVSADLTTPKDKINSFISTYNSLQTVIEAYTKITVSGNKVTAGLLSGVSEITELSRMLRRIATNPGSLSTSITFLGQLGIETSGTSSQLKVADSSLLDTQLNGSSSAVSAFFTGTAQSLSDRYTTYLDGITATTGTKGAITTLTNSLSSRSTSLDTQIAAAERRLKTERALLEAKFIQMEQAQATFQKQGQIISRSFSA